MSETSDQEDVPAHEKEYRSKDPRVRRLVIHLRTLARDADKISASRAALAELRQSIPDHIRAAPHVARYIGSKYEGDFDVVPDDELTLYRMAGLFALHRKHTPNVSLGTAFREAKADRNSESIEGRFVALLSASSEQVVGHVRSAVTLLASGSKTIGLDWNRLMDDVLMWNLPGKPRQHRLAHDFYRPFGDDTDNEGTEETNKDAVPEAATE